MSGPNLIRREDAVDAEFVTLGPVLASDRIGLVDRIAPVQPLGSLAAPAADGMAMLTRSAHLAPARSSAGPMFWVSGSVIAFAAFWVAGGHTLFDMRAAAPVGDATGLRISSVISRVDRSGTKPILLVDGKAVNDGAKSLAMPSLQIEVVTTAGRSALYKLGTSGRSLDGGDFFDFSSRLDLPKDGVKTVFVTFAQ